ncbi:sulfurtransferase TusA family protein [Paenibacillus sp. UNC451MF]|uniref:sulfurtransferase TusA family protein n=1 Tax=Paenibacillus sp. UNC451MF TaxID=1449063 RepID=UPI0005674ECC|nr:sulfurtransferase TusA family protein [Paenibacillus sp. UNC451MF]
MTELSVNQTLDCKGLACPLPVVRTKKAMEALNAGEVLEVVATDKGSVADLKSWSGRTGHQYIGLKEENGAFRHFIRKAEASDTKEEMKHAVIATNDEVHSKLASGDKLHILDVREPAEFAFGRIPGAISIPLGDLEKRLNQFDPCAEYYVVCRTGNRSDSACQMLSAKGFHNVKNVTPGMSQWTYEIEND